MSVAELSAPVRRAIFEGLVAMAWADTHLDRAEILAVHAAGELLQLPDDALDTLDEGAPSVDSVANPELSAAERRLVYLCAAWLATIDGREAPSEERLLGRLGEALEIGATDATALRDEARQLHLTTSPTVPWWEEIEGLIERAASLLER